MSQTGFPPRTASNVTLLTAQQTQEQSNTALACIPVKPVTGIGCRFVIPCSYSPIGPTKLQEAAREAERATRSTTNQTKKRIPLTPSSLKPKDPQEDAICWEVACPHSPSDRICRAGVYSCFPPRDHNRLHTGIY